MTIKEYDVIVIGAGGAGLICAEEAGKRGRKTLLLDHADKVGKKILISGGGRCNFTNKDATAERYLCANKHFVKSALSQFTAQDFISRVEQAGIAYHEKKLGQLFCDGSAKQIVDMLLEGIQKAAVKLKLNTEILNVEKEEDTFIVETSQGTFSSQSLVVATGGLSIPKLGATHFGHKLAQKFGLSLTQMAPALVPFTLNPKDLEIYSALSGTSIDALVRCGKTSFRENILLTHRGISGPAILQISSYWKPGEDIQISLLPDINWLDYLKQQRQENPKQELKTILGLHFSKNFVQQLIDAELILNKKAADLSNKDIQNLAQVFTDFTLKPHGTEGYRKAEVTLGGVDTSQLNARTLECKDVSGLHFIGEVVDVTGWLGGYNFQWAWSSGYAAGQVV